tara:strand:- start:1544 stop:1882 length:339 start_codon:yes stop_codon:yes gene_type:complete
MICPKCHAEYLSHIKVCGDCNKALIEASNIGLPNTDIDWLPLQVIEGKIYADMVIDLLNQNSIPHYVNMDWTSSAYLVEAASIPNQVIRIFVPKEYLKEASLFTNSIIGENN